MAQFGLILVGEVGNTATLASNLNCKLGALPILHFGLPVGSPFKVKHVWDEVVERSERKLAGWKLQYLCKGGRPTLVEGSLSSFYHLVNWDTICSSINDGDLGVHNLAVSNRDLLGKWLGGYACGRDGI